MTTTEESNDGWLPLVRNGDLDSLEAKLANESTIENIVRDKHGYGLLEVASMSGRTEVFAWLISHSFAPVINPRRQTCLLIAAENGELEMVKFLLQNGHGTLQERNKHESSPIIVASAKGHTDIVSYLMSMGAKITDEDKFGTCLHHAASEGRIETMRFLVHHGASITEPDNYHRTCSLLAAISGCIPAIIYAVEQGCSYQDTTERGEGILHLASQSNRVNMIAYLVNEQKIPINGRTLKGETALGMAALFGANDAAKCLIDHKADIMQLSNSGSSALHFAALRGEQEIFEMLFHAGAPRINELNGCSCSYYAILSGKTDILKFLLEKGETHEKGKSKKSCLSVGFNKGELEAVKLLLNAGIPCTYEDLDFNPQYQDKHIDTMVWVVSNDFYPLEQLEAFYQEKYVSDVYSSILDIMKRKRLPKRAAH